MRKEPSPIRSGPLYIQAGRDLISLVVEAILSPVSYDISHKPKSARVLYPAAVYVIDKKGVRRLAVRPGKSIRLPALFLGTLLMPLQYLLFEWWRRRRV